MPIPEKLILADKVFFPEVSLKDNNIKTIKGRYKNTKTQNKNVFWKKYFHLFPSKIFKKKLNIFIISTFEVTYKI